MAYPESGLKWMAAGLLLAALMLPSGTRAQNAEQTGLPVPRYASLKTEKVNVRGGPSRGHEVTFIFTRAGLPVEITAEAENWRRIRDAEGSEGWVFHSLLSGRRTVLVAPSKKNETFPLYDRAASDSRVIAQLQANVLASARNCDGKWCRISGPGFDGYVEQQRLWGVYPNEIVD
jgi:SH3-like domain-containing protein